MRGLSILTVSYRLAIGSSMPGVGASQSLSIRRRLRLGCVKILVIQPVAPTRPSDH